MLDKYIVMDIENPNTRGNSICAIGIVILEDNIIDQYEQQKLKCLVSEFSSSKMYSETTLGNV